MGRAIETRLQPARIWGLPRPWFYLSAGLTLAPLLSLTPLLQLVGWYLAALVHELGHTGASWLVGVPAVPALGITAEAATLHGDQLLPLALGVWAASALCVWRVREPDLRSGLMALLMISYPALAFGPLRETLHLASGHLFELVVAGLFLERALSGGFSSSQAERLLYGVLGWFLIGRNVSLSLALALSPTARADYSQSGSFGTTNDYVRLARELDCSLEALSVGTALLALATAPLVVSFWLWSTREHPVRRAR